MAREIHPYLVENEFTLDDINLVPTRIPRFEPDIVDYSTHLTESTVLKSPIIGSPMDTVTGSEMAILLAKLGGIGVLHNAYTIEEQIKEINRVRRWEAGFVYDPEVLGPDATIADILWSEENLGFSSYPITKDGTRETPVIGIVTGRDVRNKKDERFQTMPLSQVMTPRKNLIFGTVEETTKINNIRAANAILREHNLDILPILKKDDCIEAIVTRSDLEKDDKYPLATKDNNKQLKVYAAVESRREPAIKRIEAIATTGISGIVIDSRNIYGDYLEIAKYAKSRQTYLDVIVGNIVHPAVVKEALEEAGYLIDAFRVGIGTGEVCITTEQLGMGRAMGSALLDIDQIYQELGGDNKYGYTGFIPDGGIKFPAHFLGGAALIKNFAGVMMGTTLGGFDESLAPKIEKSPGVYVKRVRGMGSSAAVNDRYRGNHLKPAERFAEGVEKDIPAVGPGEPELKKFFNGVRTDMHGLSVRNIEESYLDTTIYNRSKAASKGIL